MNKPVIHFASRHESGNIYFILALVQTALRKERRITDFNTMRDEVFHSDSYTEALAAIRKYVDLVDDDGEY